MSLLRRASALGLFTLLLATSAHGALTVTSAQVVDATTVGQGTVFTLRVTVGGSGIAASIRTWRSTEVRANGSALQCVNLHDDPLTGGILNLVPLRYFNVAAPAATNSYLIEIVAHNNDTCSGAVQSPVFAATPNLTVVANPATPIAFVASATAVKAADATNPQEISVPVPAGSVGNVLIAIITTDGPTDVAPVDAAAWTLLDRSATTGGAPGDLFQATVGVWYRVATGTETPSYAFAWTTDASPPPEQQATGAILRYSGVDQNAPINAFATNSNFSDLVTAPGVTTTVNGAMIIRAYGSDSYATPLRFPAGTGPAVATTPVTTDPAPHGRFSVVSNTGTPINAVGSAASDSIQGVAGATGAATFETTTHPVDLPQQWRAMTIALAPAIDLQVTKVESIDPVVAGSGPGNLVYTVTLRNTGANTATNITVNDALTLPAGVSAVVTPSAGTWVSPVWTVPTLAPGATETLTVMLTVAASTIPGVDVVGDTASITGSTQSRINTGDDTVTVLTSVTASANLSVAKIDTLDPVTAGTSLTYTITVTNAGPSNAATVALTDTLPAGTTFVSLPPVPGWTCATPAVGMGGLVSCTNPVMAPGSAVFTLTVAVGAAVPTGTLITNTATASSGTTDPTPLNEGTASTTVAASADLSVTKVDTPDPVNAGSNITYTITLANAGPSNAASAALADLLQAGTTFVSLPAVAGWSCATPAVGSGGLVSCTNPSMAPGNAVFTLTVAVDASVPNGTLIGNVASASSSTTDPTPVNNGVASTNVAASADLGVTKIDTPDPVNAGTNLTYTITVANAGPSNAASASLSDTLPAGTTFVSLSSPAGWTCANPAVGAGGLVSCTNPSMAPGNAVFTLTVAVGTGVASGTVIANTATASTTTTDANASNNDGVAATTVATSGDLSVSKIDTPDPVIAGNALQYTITVNNGGPSAATSVTVTDALPAGTTFTSLSAAAGWTCTTPAVGTNGSIQCTTPSMSPGSAVFTLTAGVSATVGTGTVLSNTATVTATSPDSIPGNNWATATTTVGTGADLSVTKTANPNPVTVGGQLTYTITVANGGPSVATAATLSDPLPAGTTFVSITSPAGWTCTSPAVGANGLVQCSNPSFSVGSATFTLQVQVSASTAPGTMISNTATALSSTPDATPVNSSSTASALAVSPATLAATKSVTGSFVPGGAITYTIVIPNSGTGPQADNPGNEFIDVLPSSLTLVSATATSGTATATIATNTVAWNGSIPAGGSVTITIQATIGVASSGTVSNQGTIAFDSDGNGTNESSAQTDDPSVAGAANPTVFQITIPPPAPIPFLDPRALLLLGVLLAVCGAFVMRSS
jgi:uncharacterized repeat protein (TIGR01451 family)